MLHIFPKKNNTICVVLPCFRFATAHVCIFLFRKICSMALPPWPCVSPRGGVRLPVPRSPWGPLRPHWPGGPEHNRSLRLPSPANGYSGRRGGGADPVAYKSVVPTPPSPWEAGFPPFVLAGHSPTWSLRESAPPLGFAKAVRIPTFDHPLPGRPCDPLRRGAICVMIAGIRHRRGQRMKYVVENRKIFGVKTL